MLLRSTSSPLKGTNCSGQYVGTLTDPLVAWHHERPEPLGFSGAASTGATWYDEPQFPSAWRGGIFFADFVDRSLWFGAIEPHVGHLQPPLHVSDRSQVLIEFVTIGRIECLVECRCRISQRIEHASAML